jgi:predicted nucleic-acid-binding protein
MIGLDTNVLVRFIVRDDPAQSRLADQIIQGSCTQDDPGVVQPLVLCELVWVLARGYGYDRSAISSVLRQILAVRELRVVESERAWQALNLYERGRGDFADYLIGLANAEAGAARTVTFDCAAAGQAGVELLA